MINKHLILLGYLISTSGHAADPLLMQAESQAQTSYFTPQCGTSEAATRGRCVTGNSCMTYVSYEVDDSFDGGYGSSSSRTVAHWVTEENCPAALRIYLARNRLMPGSRAVTMTTTTIYSGTKALMTIPAGRLMKVEDVSDLGNVKKANKAFDWHARQTNGFWVKVTVFDGTKNVTGWILSRDLQN